MIRVKAVYQDANGVLEQVYSPQLRRSKTWSLPAPTPAPVLPDGSDVPSDGMHLITADLHSSSTRSRSRSSTPPARTCSTSSRTRACRSACARSTDRSTTWCRDHQTEFGASDNLFPRLLDPFFRNDQDGDAIALGPPPAAVVTNTDFGQSGDVVDADPRIISNLIVDQTSNNPAAVAVAGSRRRGWRLGHP